MGSSSVAGKRYRRRIILAMSLYLVILFGCVKLVKHVTLQGWELYGVAMLPAIPVIAVLVSLGRYLQEESDEYLKMLTMRSLIVASGALMGTLVVNDFVRALAHGDALDPFVCFVVFFVAFGIAQGVQQRASRSLGDE